MANNSLISTNKQLTLIFFQITNFFLKINHYYVNPIIAKKNLRIGFTII